MTDTPEPTKSSSSPAFNLVAHQIDNGTQVEFDLTELSFSKGKLRANDHLVLELPDDSGDWQISWAESTSGGPRWILFNHGPSIRLGSGQRIDTGDQLPLSLPVQILNGPVTLECSPSTTPVEWIEGLAVLEGSSHPSTPMTLHSSSLGNSPKATTLAHWFTALGRLQRHAFHSDDFFQAAARCVIDPGGLDGCVVLDRRGHRWSVRGAALPRPELGMAVVHELLHAVEQAHGVVFQEAPDDLPSELLIQHPAAIGAPLLNEVGDLTGILYGLRAHHRGNQRKGIRPLEAFFVQQVADAVSAAAIREKRESELTRKNLLLEQAFPSELMERLVEQPDFLQGQKRDLTVLFCDLRGFSHICNKLDGQTIYELLAQVMDFLTDRIRRNAGVVIDYFGDGLAAFWNAPIDQPNHADLACDSALRILDDLHELNSNWESRIGSPLRLGIGIHSGVALVGNSGSRFRIKYGPRGQTVNLANRIEAATKHFQLPLIVSDSTAIRLGNLYRTRRICNARLPGIEELVELHQPLTESEYESRQYEIAAYERALKLFEQGAFGACCSELTRFGNQDDLTSKLHQTLLHQAKARRDGRFNRRHSDDRIEFIPLPENARTLR